MKFLLFHFPDRLVSHFFLHYKHPQNFKGFLLLVSLLVHVLVLAALCVCSSRGEWQEPESTSPPEHIKASARLTPAHVSLARASLQPGLTSVEQGVYSVHSRRPCRVTRIRGKGYQTLLKSGRLGEIIWSTTVGKREVKTAIDLLM